MKRHMTSKHSQENDFDKFNCSFCNSQFLDKWKLERHEKIHTRNSYEFKCKHRNKEFIDEYHCQRHEEKGKCHNSNTFGRPKKDTDKCRTLVWRESRRIVEGIMSDETVKNNVIKQISKVENWGVKELTDDDAIKLITDIDMSDNKFIKMLRYLKSKVSKGIYSKKMVSALSSRKTIFKELTDNEVLTFHDSHNKEINKNLIFINDIEAMIDIVTVARGISVEESSIVVSVDGGKGRLLVTLSILGSKSSFQSFKDFSAKRTIVVTNLIWKKIMMRSLLHSQKIIPF